MPLLGSAPHWLPLPSEWKWQIPPVFRIRHAHVFHSQWRLFMEFSDSFVPAQPDLTPRPADVPGYRLNIKRLGRVWQTYAYVQCVPPQAIISGPIPFGGGPVFVGGRLPLNFLNVVVIYSAGRRRPPVPVSAMT